LRYCIQVDYRGQTEATIKSFSVNSRYRIGNDYRSQTAATVKSAPANTCYRIGNDYRSQTVASGKSAIVNPRYRIGNTVTSVFSARVKYQYCLVFIEQNAIDRRVGCIGVLNIDGCQTVATVKNFIAHTRYRIGNSY
jgi:hypothetical protein